MFWLTLAGTMVVIPAATAAWMLVVREYQPSQWDSAPLAGLCCVLVVWGPEFAAQLAIGNESALWPTITLAYLGMGLGWVSQLILEDVMIDRPSTVDPVRERFDPILD